MLSFTANKSEEERENQLRSDPMASSSPPVVLLSPACVAHLMTKITGRASPHVGLLIGQSAPGRKVLVLRCRSLPEKLGTGREVNFEKTESIASLIEEMDEMLVPGVRVLGVYAFGRESTRPSLGAYRVVYRNLCVCDADVTEMSLCTRLKMKMNEKLTEVVLFSLFLSLLFVLLNCLPISIDRYW